MTSTSITSGLDHMVDRVIRTTYKWFTERVIRLKGRNVQDVNFASMSVADFISVLRKMPQDYMVSFQIGDTEDSQLMTLASVKTDSLWEIVDVLLREGN